MKTCTVCHISKAKSEFVKVKPGSRFLRSLCRACISVQKASWYAKNPGYDRKKLLWINYHILPRTYEALELAQCGQCAICGQTEDGTRSLAVDHDHATGQIRALLCSLCNVGLGAFKDSPERLRQASGYLEEN